MLIQMPLQLRQLILTHLVGKQEQDISVMPVARWVVGWVSEWVGGLLVGWVINWVAGWSAEWVGGWLGVLLGGWVVC